MRRISDIVVTPDERIAPRKARPASRAKSSLGKIRRGRAPLLTPLQKTVAIGLIATVLIAILAGLWASGTPQRLAGGLRDGVLDLTARAGLRLGEITVTGRGRTGNDTILDALGVHMGDPILGIDLRAAKARLEAVPSIRAAAIERRLPSRLHVVIAERQPMALWQHDSQFSLIDRDGHVIPGGLEGFEDLPLVVGDGAPVAAADLLAMLATEPALAARVKAAVRVGYRRWDLHLDDPVNGLEVKLPEENAESAWHRLAQLEGNHDLSRRHVASIDMRLSDRLILTPERRQAGDPAAKNDHDGA